MTPATQPTRRLLGVEWLTIVYVVITTIMTLFYFDTLQHPIQMLGLRAIAAGLIVLANMAALHLSPRWALAVRSMPLLALLVWWYPETYDFCSQLPYKDHWFAAADQQLFGCQPSLLFAEVLPQTLWSEAFNMGYYAYYYMMAAVIIYYIVRQPDDYNRATTIFLGSFFVFYLIFEFLPVGGPQYYFQALTDIYGVDVYKLTGHTAAAAQELIKINGSGTPAGMFPDVGHYFASHEAAMLPEVKGIFSQLVIGAQEYGEHPTAAFPSSHVGMSTVIMLLAWRADNRRLFYILMPFYLLLVAATVYIRAHYLIDSIAGLIFAAILYYLFNRFIPYD
ncbi:MAG: phosphatase PAP2 family protein [Bacteroidaceae bacterium]|nr:phosphatase PAP2 family protein [Bacteroidaceae bacterium]